MNKTRQAKVRARLRALFDVVAAEARVNLAFAAKLEACLDQAGAVAAPERTSAPAAAMTQDSGKPATLLRHVTFDPLEIHIEAAILSGREHEARDFLGKLDRLQLDEVVRAQRLPGAKDLQKTIVEEDVAAAVDAIVGSAAGRVRGRLSAAS